MSVLLLEPFYGGSHKQLLDLLQENIAGCVKITLPAKKWHWRARTSALFFMESVPASSSYRVLFTSSVLNLAELVALRPDLARLKKVLYFHENQLVYPVRKVQERDFQYGYNQILSCLVADVVVFNSSYNMESFLNSIGSFLKTMPDHRPQNLDRRIRTKSRVLHFPLRLPDVTRFLPAHKRERVPDSHARAGQSEECSVAELSSERGSPDQKLSHQHHQACHPDARPLHIVWPHRWEHDKDPQLFFQTLLKLKERELSFSVSVLGETFSDLPDVFSQAKEQLVHHIQHWGFMPSKEDYLSALCQADVVVSTAKHEFFGVAMLEAVHCGCFPLCPKALVYPEIYPETHLYSTPGQLCRRLQEFCRRPHLARQHRLQVNLAAFSWETLSDDFRSLLEERNEHAHDAEAMP